MDVKPKVARRRIETMGRCKQKCPSCTVCGPMRPKSLTEALSASAGLDEFTLGGGNVMAWPSLAAFMAERGEVSVWLEAPAGALSADALNHCVTLGVSGVVVIAEATGRACSVLKVGDPVEALSLAKEKGLGADGLLLCRPKTLTWLFRLPFQFPDSEFELELIQDDWTAARVAYPVDSLSILFRRTSNVRFASRKSKPTLFAPPCTTPELFAADPAVWANVLREKGDANDVLPECADCALRGMCAWSDVAALGDLPLQPIESVPDPDESSGEQEGFPALIRSGLDQSDVICTTAWTVMEITDEQSATADSGKVNPCCGSWTHTVCAKADSGSLVDIWNGSGYRNARAALASAVEENRFCRSVCPRVHDQAWSAKNWTMTSGSDRFVENQHRIADDIINRRQIATGMPTQMVISGSTYCNYDCIMCTHGRTQRRDIPNSVWEELPEFLPYLATLGITGGEPLADPRVRNLLATVDTVENPDVRLHVVTNASLMTARFVKEARLEVLGGISVSMNSGTPENYLQIQRGLELPVILDHIDGLLEARAEQNLEFGVELSFVVQPESSHTLLPFAEIAASRNLGIRLLPMTPAPTIPTYYNDPDKVARVLGHLAEFEKAVAGLNLPEWSTEIRGVTEAIRTTALAEGGMVES